MLTALAAAIFAVLRNRVPSPAGQITYDDLVHRLGALPPPNAGLSARDPRLDAALGELVRACRANNLPAISALVVRADTGQPGVGYYPVADPATANDDALRTIAWGNEMLLVRATNYPTTL